uniref:Peptide chain release factor 3 (RF-3) n=1 Tax=Providencia alcalifaciens Ban1 TaxID=663916 RepID=C9E4B1_9GAMM|nr:peptide chain release factor 3 (RF-3) [Providencia alcalifaciens Ban1]
MLIRGVGRARIPTTPYFGEVSKRRTFAIISHPDAAQPFNA